MSKQYHQCVVCNVRHDNKKMHLWNFAEHKQGGDGTGRRICNAVYHRFMKEIAAAQTTAADNTQLQQQQQQQHIEPTSLPIASTVNTTSHDHEDMEDEHVEQKSAKA